jgi:hypothetical protein
MLMWLTSPTPEEGILDTLGAPIGSAAICVDIAREFGVGRGSVGRHLAGANAAAGAGSPPPRSETMAEGSKAGIQCVGEFQHPGRGGRPPSPDYATGFYPGLRGGGVGRTRSRCLC